MRPRVRVAVPSAADGHLVGPQLGLHYLGGRVPYAAVSPLLEPPSVSSSDHESDPEWTQ